ncbi:MAG TPA: ABC transporter permease [Ureibacillus sp.]|nr:ABC transporter permease [Ureibacillus sp.]
MRIAALVKRILLQIRRDKRTLALLFVAPIIVLTLMNLVFNGDPVEPELGIYSGNEQLVEKLVESDIIVHPYEDVIDLKTYIVEDDLDGFLQVDGINTMLTLQNDDPTIAKNLEMKVKQVLQQQFASAPMQQAISQPIIETDYVYGDSETVLFDTFSPILVGFFVFFFVFLIAGIGLLNERTTGTLERLLATPIKRGEIVSGYMIAYGLLAVIQTVIIVLFAVNVLDIVLVGSMWHVILINIVLALVALSLGILLSTFASSEFQMVQFIPLIIVPQVFFSGIFSIEGMAGWLQVLAKFMPLYYAADALKGVMYKGGGLGDISSDLYILLGFTIVFIILNMFTLKKYRKL